MNRQILPAVVAHRGASRTEPENTIRAFDAAVEAGADYIELDVRLTVDAVAVVMHDLDVSTTTDGSGFVHQLTLAEVKRLDASGGQGPRTEVPTLREVLERVWGRVGVNIEIKNNPGEPAFDSPREAAAEQVVRILDELAFPGPVLVSSFNWLSIERIQELDGAIATGFLSSAVIDPRAALVYVRSRGHGFVLPEVDSLLATTDSFIEEAHADGIRVGTWTVDDAEALGRLFAMGVDAVASNDPATAVAVRDRFRSAS